MGYNPVSVTTVLPKGHWFKSGLNLLRCPCPYFDPSPRSNILTCEPPRPPPPHRSFTREGSRQNHRQAASGQKGPNHDVIRDQLHGEAVPPQHRASLRGAGEQPEALPDDGVRQWRRPVLQDHHQGEAERAGDQADVCSDRLCCQTHGKFFPLRLARRPGVPPPGPGLLRPTTKKKKKKELNISWV